MSAGPRVVALGASCALALTLGAASAGCASGYTETPDSSGHAIDTGVHIDTGPRPDAGDTGPHPDTGPMPDGGTSTDAGGSLDASRACGSMVCMGFTHCVSGTCMAYPMCRGDGTCPTAGDICIALRCVPGDVDIDGDGSPARLDCDETDPTRSPLRPEICNNRDDNCNMMIDDGDPATLCAMDPHHGICMAGACGCPAGTADLDLTVPGCECSVHPGAMGLDCASPIDMGSVFDEAAGGAQMLTAMGNALDTMGATRDVWYHFHATDVADTACDHFNVHVAFTVNPANAYEFLVLRGTCGGAASCTDCTGAMCTSFTDYRFAVDAQAGMVGQCPCTAAASTTVNQCSDDSGEYYVRVRRHMGMAVACAQYTLAVTNGMM